MAITRRCITFASNKVVQLYIVVGLHYIGNYLVSFLIEDHIMITCLYLVCASEYVLKH